MTVSGKVDVNALPAPPPPVAAGPAPVDGTEALVAQAWCEVLGLPAVGREVSFFDAGGTSLTLARLQYRLAHPAEDRVELGAGEHVRGGLAADVVGEHHADDVAAGVDDRSARVARRGDRREHEHLALGRRAAGDVGAAGHDLLGDAHRRLAQRPAARDGRTAHPGRRRDPPPARAPGSARPGHAAPRGRGRDRTRRRCASRRRPSLVVTRVSCSPATTCALVTTRFGPPTNPVPSWMRSHACAFDEQRRRG